MTTQQSTQVKHTHSKQLVNSNSSLLVSIITTIPYIIIMIE